MPKSLIEVARDAAALSEIDRLKLARILLDLSESSGIQLEVGVEKAWDDEITRRLRELRTGEVQGVPLTDVKRKIEARFAS